MRRRIVFKQVALRIVFRALQFLTLLVARERGIELSSEAVAFEFGAIALNVGIYFVVGSVVEEGAFPFVVVWFF